MATVSTSRCPAAISRTTDGRVSVTSRAAPGTRPVNRTGLTRPDGNTSESDPTSCRPMNRIASVVVAAVTTSRTVDAPATNMRSGSGSEAKRATWPERLEIDCSGLLAPAPCAASSALPSCGSTLTAAGFPPAGALICCGRPWIVTVSVKVGWPSMPG